jgi:hypothetical protein
MRPTKKTTKKPVPKATKPAPKAKKPAPRGDKPDAEAAVLAKIAAMPAPFRAMGERLHALIMRAAPTLQPSLFYGMPWYAKDGKRICFFRADKLMTFGLTEDANLTREQGARHQLLPSAWYLAGLDAATEARLAAIVRTAAS